MTHELLLAGGNMGPVHRRGDVVLRVAGPWTPAVHRLMTHCRDRGVVEIPLPRAVEPDGREAIEYVPGEVPNYPMPSWLWQPEVLLECGRLLRRFHDASASADRAGPWRTPPREPAEVVCHNDFAPYNLVFRDHRPVGIIDFDYAAPGPRLWDLAYLAYRVVPLTIDRADGFDDQERMRRLEQLLSAYGCDPPLREILDTVATRLAELADFSVAKASELGKPELAEHARLYRLDARYCTHEALT